MNLSGAPPPDIQPAGIANPSKRTDANSAAGLLAWDGSFAGLFTGFSELVVWQLIKLPAQSENTTSV